MKLRLRTRWSIWLLAQTFVALEFLSAGTLARVDAATVITAHGEAVFLNGVGELPAEGSNLAQGPQSARIKITYDPESAISNLVEEAGPDSFEYILDNSTFEIRIGGETFSGQGVGRALVSNDVIIGSNGAFVEDGFFFQMNFDDFAGQSDVVVQSPFSPSSIAFNLELAKTHSSSDLGSSILSSGALPAESGDITPFNDPDSFTVFIGETFVDDEGSFLGNQQFAVELEPSSFNLSSDEIPDFATTFQAETSWSKPLSVEIDDGEIIVNVDISLTGDVQQAQELIGEWRREIDRVWSNSYLVEEGDAKYPVRLDVEFFSDSPDAYQVEFFGGEAPISCAVFDCSFDMLNWYFDLEATTGHDPSLLPTIIAHEVGHMLGLYDEYRYLDRDVPTLDPNVPFEDNCIFVPYDGNQIRCNNIMSDLTGGAEARHFDEIVSFLSDGIDRDLSLAQAPSFVGLNFDRNLLGTTLDGEPPAAIQSVPLTSSLSYLMVALIGLYALRSQKS